MQIIIDLIICQNFLYIYPQIATRQYNLNDKDSIAYGRSVWTSLIKYLFLKLIEKFRLKRTQVDLVKVTTRKIKKSAQIFES